MTELKTCQKQTLLHHFRTFVIFNFFFYRFWLFKKCLGSLVFFVKIWFKLYMELSTQKLSRESLHVYWPLLPYYSTAFDLSLFVHMANARWHTTFKCSYCLMQGQKANKTLQISRMTWPSHKPEVQLLTYLSSTIPKARKSAFPVILKLFMQHIGWMIL